LRTARAASAVFHLHPAPTRAHAARGGGASPSLWLSGGAGRQGSAAPLRGRLRSDGGLIGSSLQYSPVVLKPGALSTTGKVGAVKMAILVRSSSPCKHTHAHTHRGARARRKKKSGAKVWRRASYFSHTGVCGAKEEAHLARVPLAHSPALQDCLRWPSLRTYVTAPSA